MKLESEKVIRDLAALDTSQLLQMNPIPPVLFELVTLIAIMAADADHKTFLETGIDPISESQGKEGVHG